jgi:fructose-bisphosphate aldolase class II
MRVAVAAFLIVGAGAFAPSTFRTRQSVSVKGIANDIGIPCEEECALECFPNMPASVHPGVLTGQAMMDLLQHAKDNGKKLFDDDWDLLV